MYSLRIARATARFIPTATRLSFQTRGYADAVSDKIQLTLALPHQVSISPDSLAHPPAFLPHRSGWFFSDLQSIYKSTDVYVTIAWLWARILLWHLYANLALMMSRVQVNLPAESGEMGVLANHVPTIEQLKPGLVEIVEESGGSKSFFRMWINSVNMPITYLFMTRGHLSWTELTGLIEVPLMCNNVAQCLEGLPSCNQARNWVSMQSRVSR